MRARTQEEWKRSDDANAAHRKAWEVDGEKARKRLRKATSALHANPRDEAVVQEFLDATEQVKANNRLVAELDDARKRVFAEIERAIELEHHTTGMMTSYEKVTFINGMKKFVRHEEVDGLRRRGLLKEDDCEPRERS
jgi:DNA polymerase II large subunit